MGLMERMRVLHEKYDPEDFVRSVTLDTEIAPQLFRKLKNVATLIDSAEEIEDFQSIGVQCREILIELGNHIFIADMAGTKVKLQKKGGTFYTVLFDRFR